MNPCKDIRALLSSSVEQVTASFTSFSLVILACFSLKSQTTTFKWLFFCALPWVREPQNPSQQKGIGSPSSARWDGHSLPIPQWFQFCSKSRDFFLLDLLDEKIRHSSVCLSVCLNFFFARKIAQILPNPPFPIRLAFLLLCLHFSFQPRGVRSWAILAQVPHCEVRDQGLEETIRWLSVTDDGPVPIPTPSPPSSPPYPGFHLRNKERKKTAVWRKPAAASADSGWGLGVHSICSLCYAFTLLLPLPKPKIKWRIFLGSFVTENGFKSAVYSVFRLRAAVRGGEAGQRLKLLPAPRKRWSYFVFSFHLILEYVFNVRYCDRGLSPILSDYWNNAAK